MPNAQPGGPIISPSMPSGFLLRAGSGRDPWRIGDAPPARREGREGEGLVFRRIQRIHKSTGMGDTGSWLGGWRHGADGMCSCRWGGARAAGGDRGRPQPATKARRAGAHRACLSGSGVGAARGATHRRQSADGVALATAFCRSGGRGFVARQDPQARQAADRSR